MKAAGCVAANVGVLPTKNLWWWPYARMSFVILAGLAKLPSSNILYRSLALKSHTKLRAAIKLRAALGIFYYIKSQVYLL